MKESFALTSTCYLLNVTITMQIQRTFLPLWETLQAELDQLSTIHTEYASAIVETVENPLRATIPTNADYAHVQSVCDSDKDCYR